MSSIKINDILETKVLTCNFCNQYLTTSPIQAIMDERQKRQILQYCCGTCLEHIVRKDKVSNFKVLELPCLSKLMESITFPCKYVHLGCFEKLSNKMYGSHVENCKYSKTYCKICNWKGPKMGILNHFKSKHEIYIIKSTSDSEESFDVTHVLESQAGDVNNTTKAKAASSGTSDKMKNIICFLSTSVGIILCTCKILKDAEVKLTAFDELLSFEEISIKITKENKIREYQIQLGETTVLEGPKNLKEENCTVVIKMLTKTSRDVSKKMLESIECPVCKDSMMAPIYQCSRGHNICSPCKQKLPKCPQCSFPYYGARNFALEVLVDEINRPCRYENEGCAVRCKRVNKHEDKCLFRPYSCPVEFCKATKIYGFDNISKHISVAHKDLCTVGSYLDCSSLDGLEYYLICYENVFIIRNPQDVANISFEGLRKNSILEKMYVLEIAILSTETKLIEIYEHIPVSKMRRIILGDLKKSNKKISSIRILEDPI